MGIYERIQQKVEEKGITIKKLEKETGLGNGIIKRWTTSSPQSNKLLAVANYLNTSLDWLVTGKNTDENMTKEEQELIKKYRIADEIDKNSIKRILNINEQSEKSSGFKTG